MDGKHDFGPTHLGLLLGTLRDRLQALSISRWALRGTRRQLLLLLLLLVKMLALPDIVRTPPTSEPWQCWSPRPAPRPAPGQKQSSTAGDHPTIPPSHPPPPTLAPDTPPGATTSSAATPTCGPRSRASAACAACRWRTRATRCLPPRWPASAGCTSCASWRSTRTRGRTRGSRASPSCRRSGAGARRGGHGGGLDGSGAGRWVAGCWVGWEAVAGSLVLWVSISFVWGAGSQRPLCQGA
jgi:hypothetical protein